MEQSELLHFVVEALERIGLRYFVTGSTATIFFGEPRFTNDIDVVRRLDRPRLDDRPSGDLMACAAALPDVHPYRPCRVERHSL